MSVKELLEPILEQGIRYTNYFEGRLLTGEDLRDQQTADRERDRRIGQAVGTGIIEGLEVSLDVGRDGSDGNPPVVTVKKGLAITPGGEIIGLPNNDIKLALSKTEPAVAFDAVDFFNCAGPPGNQSLPNGTGIYILVMSPTAGYKERAPKSGLGDNNVVKGCGSKYIQDGVQFRLIEVAKDTLIDLGGITDETKHFLENSLLTNIPPLTKADQARVSKLRNMLAHLCFGIDQLDRFAIAPLNCNTDQYTCHGYTVVDALRDTGDVTDCDVPLALICWTLEGIAFMDMWSVRRVLSGYERINGPGKHVQTIKGLMVAKSLLLQFQDQLQDLFDLLSDPTAMIADDYFFFLPPLGILPVSQDQANNGVDYKVFLGERILRDPVYIDGAHLFSVINESFNYPVIYVNSGELIWLYLVRQNRQKIDSGDTVTQKYLIFTNGNMLFRGHARFNLARWDYSNYASIID